MEDDMVYTLIFFSEEILFFVVKNKMLLKIFLEFMINLKLFHWNTHSYARHKASDECFENLSKLLDTFVETFIGRYGRNIVKQETRQKVELVVLTETQIVKIFRDFTIFLENLEEVILDSDLLNIRDEMLSTVQKTLYLFTLK